MKYRKLIILLCLINNEGIGEAEQIILQRAEENGFIKILSQVQKRYGAIVTSDDSDYFATAMSFLNTFEPEIRELISESRWFIALVSNRINLYTLSQELDCVKFFLENYDKGYPIEKMIFSKKQYYEWLILDEVALPSKRFGNKDNINGGLVLRAMNFAIVSN